MEEERLSQRDAVDGVVHIVALVQLHLVERAEQSRAGEHARLTCRLRKKHSGRPRRRRLTHRQRGQVLGRRLDVPAEVELIDLPEGDDVDPGDVAAAHLLGGGGGRMGGGRHGDYCTEAAPTAFQKEGNVNGR